MTWFTCAAATVLLLIGLSCAMLPFLSVWDHRLAIARRRSLYDKSAGQVESLTAVMQLFFAGALGADLLCGGFIDSLMVGPWRFLWAATAMSAAFAALCSVLVLFAPKALRTIISVISGLTAVFSACLLSALSWAFFMGALGTAEPEAAEQAFIVIAAGLQSLGFILFAGFALCLAVAAAYGLALCWHILCRSRDDFGRDYYAFVLGMRGRQASISALLLTACAALMYVVDMGHPSEQAAAQSTLAAAYLGGMLCLPAASAVWFALSRSAVPMQKRSFAFIGMALVTAGAYCAIRLI